MTTTERVRELCKERGIAVSNLEKQLGFGNGYLNPKKQKDIKDMSRIMKIAEFFDVSVEYLTTGIDRRDEALTAREMLFENDEQRILFEASKGAPKSAMLEAAALIQRYKEMGK